MEAGFVAVHEREGSRVGKGLKGCRHAVDWRNSRGIGSVGIEHAGFDGPRAAHAPGGADHFLDEAELYGAGGLVALDVLGEDGLNPLPTLPPSRSCTATKPASTCSTSAPFTTCFLSAPPFQTNLVPFPNKQPSSWDMLQLVWKQI